MEILALLWCKLILQQEVRLEDVRIYVPDQMNTAWVKVQIINPDTLSRWAQILVGQCQSSLKKTNLVSQRANRCERFPIDVESCPCPRLHGHVTPKAPCLTVNNPSIIKPSQIRANPL